MGEEDGSEAYARGSDPSTSHEAARRVKVTRLETDVYIALGPFWPRWVTSIQIAAAMGIDKWSVSPRMAPLERKGYVERRTIVATNSEGKLRNMHGYRVIRRQPVQLALAFPVSPVSPVSPNEGAMAEEDGDVAW